MTGETMEHTLAARAGRLFAAYRDGDETKMAELVSILTPILWHTARACRLDTAAAEDVLQTVWLALVRKADSIAEPMAVLQWMVISTKREAWRVVRIQAKVTPEDMEAAGSTPGSGARGRPAATWSGSQARSSVEADPGPSVEEQAMQGASDTRLWQHIEALPERCRALLRVIAFADRPDYAEIARALGMPQGSIGPTRGRCLAKLRVALAQDPTWER